MLEQPVNNKFGSGKNFIKFFSAKYRKFFQSGFFPRKNIKILFKKKF